MQGHAAEFDGQIIRSKIVVLTVQLRGLTPWISLDQLGRSNFFGDQHIHFVQAAICVVIAGHNTALVQVQRGDMT